MNGAAVLQNRVGIDGRSRVLGEVIPLLRDAGLDPTLITFSGQAACSRFAHAQGMELGRDFKVARIPIPLPARGTSYQLPLLNALAGRRLRSFDVVFNSNNVLQFLPPGPRYIHYIHQPPEAEFAQNPRFQALRWRLFSAPLRALYARSPRQSLGHILANSEYTLRGICAFYPELSQHARVLYPPTVEAITKRRVPERVKRVVSVGAYLPDKRQLEQIRLAASMPHLEFVMVGAARSKSYYRLLKEEIRLCSAGNVRLVPDAKRSQVEEELRGADIFLHMMVSEHFGIAAVEAMAAGCIPVVHDSGGQIETVPVPELRFRSLDEARDRLQMVSSLSVRERQKLLERVQENTARFLTPAFRDGMKKILAEG